MKRHSEPPLPSCQDSCNKKDNTGGDDVEQFELSSPAGGKAEWRTRFGKQFGDFW